MEQLGRICNQYGLELPVIGSDGACTVIAYRFPRPIDRQPPRVRRITGGKEHEFADLLAAIGRHAAATISASFGKTACVGQRHYALSIDDAIKAFLAEKAGLMLKLESILSPATEIDDDPESSLFAQRTQRLASRVTVTTVDRRSDASIWLKDWVVCGRESNVVVCCQHSHSALYALHVLCLSSGQMLVWKRPQSVSYADWVDGLFACQTKKWYLGALQLLVLKRHLVKLRLGEILFDERTFDDMTTLMPPIGFSKYVGRRILTRIMFRYGTATPAGCAGAITVEDMCTLAMIWSGLKCYGRERCKVVYHV